MIVVDSRVGSKELHRLFPVGMSRLGYLEYGDFSITGNGSGGPVMVGVERKRIGDFINSMCTGRLSGRQLIGMLNSYHHVYLVIEGMFRANPKTGVLETWRRGGWDVYHAGRRTFMARDIWVFMNTLAVVCGVKCYHCSTPTDTVYYLVALHHWWNKEYDKHKSHLMPSSAGHVRLFKQTVLRRTAAQLDGVGMERAKALDEAFGSVAELVAATEEELMAVEGVGKKLAKGIREQLRGEEAV